MTEQAKLLTLQEIEDKIIANDGKCANISCNRKIQEGTIRNYDHKGGIQVKGYTQKQWVYFECYWCQIPSSIQKVMRAIKFKREQQ